ncbi:MAG: class I SAM-dependent RNA methyltransferase [Pyrinomonadaceae bacterium]
MSNKYQIGDVIHVRIEKIVPRGFGLGFGDGLTVFVPLSVPGDVLRVEIREIKKRTAFAEIAEIVSPGAERIAPPCPYFGTCGGCDFQQLGYSAQLRAKVAIIEDSLTRIGKIEWAGAIRVVGSPQEFAYRSRARWHFNPERKAVGYYARNSHDVIHVEICPILTPELESRLQEIRDEVAWENIWSSDAQIEAAAGDQGKVSMFSNDLAQATVDIAFENDDFTYHYSAESFFQANKELIPALVDTAVGQAGGELAVDLYCGVGLFTMPLARRFKRVIGVEGNELSASFAKKNVELAGLTNVELARSSVRRFLDSNRELRPDFVLLDPPRSGTDPGTIEALTGLNPAHITYVACDPSLLARDLRKLLDAGYAVESVIAIDLFPQTHHVETIVHLKK